MAGSILTASGAVPLTNCVSTLAIVVVGPTAMHNLPFSLFHRCHDHHHYSLCLPMRLCQAEWTWMAGYMAQDSLPGRRLSPTPPLTELNVEHYCYLIIRNAEASLVEIKSRDRHYKRILLLLCTHGCKYECKQCIFTSY